MRTRKRSLFTLIAVAFLLSLTWGAVTTFANTTITLDQPVHFTTAEGSVVLLEDGDYKIEPAETWLRITPHDAPAVEALLIDAQVGTHEEPLTAPIALSLSGEQPDTHHVALLLPDGTRLESVGTYSGIRSRAGSFFLSPTQIRSYLANSQSSSSSEFVTPTFGGSGGTRSYNLDCGREAVMIGVHWQKRLLAGCHWYYLSTNQLFNRGFRRRIYPRTKRRSRRECQNIQMPKWIRHQLNFRSIWTICEFN